MFRAYEDHTVVRPVVENDLARVLGYRDFSAKAARKRRFVSLCLILAFVFYIGLDTYALNRMTAAGGTSITYTSAGNISAIGADTLVYNKANQLATATVSGTASAYVYDAFGQRLTSTVGAGTPVIQQYGMGGLLLSETQGAAETNYVYLNGMPIASINTASPAISYVHTNHLGTPQKATNSGQSVVWSGAYQPFGAVTPTTSITQNLRFPGQYADPTGFNYNMYRNYNPALGRYLESDPIGLAGGINTYNYAANNPYKFIDPLGLDTQYSGSFGATLGVIYWGIGGSVSLGINVPDDPKNIDGYQVFGSAQGNAMVGVGVFAGFGVGLGKSTSDGPLPVLDGQLSAYAEANIGIGKSIGGSVQAPLTVAECTANNPNGTVMSANRGYSVGAPIPKGGEGVGFWVGAGPAASGTIATPTPKRVKEYFNRVNP